MSTRLISSKLNNDVAELFVSSIADIPHFITLGKHTSFIPDDQTLPTPVETQQTFTANLYNDMLFGKMLAANDVSLMVPRHDWQSGVVFDMYVDNDGDLLTKPFYASVNAGSFYHVYKCLDNNNGANSTVEPSGQDLQPFVTPSDGYMWKYMYTFPSSMQTKFSTNDFMPVLANSAVVAAAAGGSIETILVNSAGAGYDNYISGTFRAQDVAIGGEETSFGLVDTASSLNGFYQNCIIKMTSGLANNEFRNIVSYAIVSGQKVIGLDSGFDQLPSATDTYEIYPSVAVTGDGKETSTTSARAIINPNSANSVSSVEVLDAGLGYRVASAGVFPHPSVGVDLNADLTPVISPADGHGHDPEEELGSHYACLSTTFTGSDSNTVPTSNDYRQFYLLQNPLFANINLAIDFSTIVGSFSLGETIYNCKVIPLSGTVSVSNSSSVVTGSNTVFTTSLELGDMVLIGSGSNQFLANVFFIANNTSLNLDTNIDFTAAVGTISLVRNNATATVVQANTSTLVLNNCSAKLSADYPVVIGSSSFTSVNINQSATPIIGLNGTSVNNFQHFVQLSKITGTLTSGVFQEDEVVVQGANTYTAKFFSYTSGTPAYVYMSNETGTFNPNTTLIGQSSGAVFTPANKYPGALEVDSGEVLYFENISPITRDSAKSETFKIILEF